MPKKETWLSNKQLEYIRKDLGIKEGEPDKGFSEWIKEAVQEKIDKAVEERNKKVLKGRV